MAKNQEKFNLTIGAKDKASKTIAGINKNLAGMAAAFMSVAVAVKAFNAVFNAALQHESAYNDLAAAVKRMGSTWRSTENDLRSFTDKMQTLTGISDEVHALSLQILLDYGMTIPEAMDALTSAVDLAAARHMALQTTVDLVGKAFVGYTGTLSRYGIIVDEGLSSTEKYSEAMRQMGQFSGAAAAKMNTTEGRLKLLNERFGDFLETLGMFLLDIPLLDWFSDVISLVNQSTTAWGKFETVLKAVVGIPLDELTVDLKEANEAAAQFAKELREFHVQSLVFEMDIFNMDTVVNKAAKSTRSIDDIINELTGNIAEGGKHWGAFSSAVGDALQTVGAGLFDLSEDVDEAMGGAASGIEKVTKKITAQIRELNRLDRALGMVAGEYGQFAAPEGQRFGDDTGYGDFQERLDSGFMAGAEEKMERYKEHLDKAADASREFATETQMALSGVGDYFVDMAMGIQTNWGDMLRAMVADFMRAMFRMGIQRAFFSTATAATAAAGGPAGLAYYGMSSLMAGGTPALGRTVIVNINGTIVGNQEYVRKDIIPYIEQAVRLGHSALTVRGNS